MAELAPLFIVLAMAAGGEDEAARTSARAYYKQSGLDERVREAEKRALSKEERRQLGYLAAAVRVAAERRVMFTVRFP